MNTHLPTPKIIRLILIVIFIVLFTGLIFQAGVFIGYRKALFINKYGDNYFNNLDHPHGMFGKEAPGDDLMGGHGAVGKIISISFPLIVIEEPDNLEKVIVINNSTEFRLFRDASNPNDLKIDQHIVVLGSSNEQGQIEAKLIRLIPLPN